MESEFLVLTILRGMKWFVNTIFLSLCSLLVFGQKWSTISNQAKGTTLQFSTCIEDKFHQHHIFIGYRRSNSAVGKNNPMVYYQVEQKKLQVFDMDNGVVMPPVYDASLHCFKGMNRQPALVWKLIPRKDSAQLIWLSTPENKVMDNMTFSPFIQKEGKDYFVTSPAGKLVSIDYQTGEINNWLTFDSVGTGRIERAAFKFLFTPQGFATSYRNNLNGHHYVFYKNFKTQKTYTTDIGYDLLPVNIYPSLDFSEKIGMVVNQTNQAPRFYEIDSIGFLKEINKESFNLHFLLEKKEKKTASAPLKVDVITNGSVGTAKISNSNGKIMDTFSFHIPVDLQPMEYMGFHPKFGFLGTFGKYQPIYLIDSINNEGCYKSINGEEISTYAFGGKTQLYVLGYPSKVSQYDGNNLVNLISSNSFPKYFEKSVSLNAKEYWLGRNERERVGSQIFEFNPVNQQLKEPWKLELDSILHGSNILNIFTFKNYLMLFYRDHGKMKAIQLNPFSLKCFELKLHEAIDSIIIKNQIWFQEQTGNYAIYSQNKLFIFDINSPEYIRVIETPGMSVDSKISSVMYGGWIQKNVLLVSASHANPKALKKGMVFQYDLKSNKMNILKDDFISPRPMVIGNKRVLFYAGNKEQTSYFDIMSW